MHISFLVLFIFTLKKKQKKTRIKKFFTYNIFSSNIQQGIEPGVVALQANFTIAKKLVYVKEGGDKGLFITPVPKVFLLIGLTTLGTFLEF